MLLESAEEDSLMAHPSYLRKILKTGEVERVAFSAEHYKAVGVPAALYHGLPVLEAHQLINHWNVNQITQEYVYALE
jgi:hypothetical protein